MAAENAAIVAEIEARAAANSGFNNLAAAGAPTQREALPQGTPERAAEGHGAQADGAWRCEECNLAWPTRSGLVSHLTRRHGHRNWLRHFAPGSGECPVCRVLFHNRYRLLAHLRKGSAKCRLHIELGGVVPLPEATVRKLDAAEAAERREAKRAGGWADAGLPARPAH